MLLCWQEKSKSYITKDNIDDAIEKALSSHVDFNFAIDKNGNVYQGRNTNPLNSKEASSEDKLMAQNNWYGTAWRGEQNIFNGISAWNPM